MWFQKSLEKMIKCSFSVLIMTLCQVSDDSASLLLTLASYWEK